MAGPAGIATVEGKAPKKGPKMLDELRIKRSLNGGHSITHHYEGYQHEPKTYSFGPQDKARAAAHVARHAGFPLEGGAEEEENADEDTAETQSAKEMAPVKGAGSKHNNARVA
jgi:hypothetical protein